MAAFSGGHFGGGFGGARGGVGPEVATNGGNRRGGGYGGYRRGFGYGGIYAYATIRALKSIRLRRL